MLVHSANRLLSESTLILRMLRSSPVEGERVDTSPRLRSIPKPHAFSMVVFCGLRIFSSKAMRSGITRCKW